MREKTLYINVVETHSQDQRAADWNLVSNSTRA